jgi:1-phosphatidylinositol-4-phosphate 5-kinase|mmetsp:Transcript_34520/g.45407  ORF Transcript_34520/g.45407 Transcript_34520/m.45407 type:complete len:151 (+) Transcript_34520:1607-2059(+)|eukprot:CAMPEP_0170469184 /NCGR_PEP_ID=MMETSP0123-20130129/12102_1 /TAXON_ID=182087 /ORGANISM="Favella ehrenbergii, Strain Fehren 1" /LENGTH=150 /DNA_ID=CAMNT_0010735975 /DNA_START=146 /DNA_END=598 /DNA_ORIENTATION=-
MTEDDFNAWMRIQKHYFKHVMTNENSLLARVYGVYSVRMEDQKPVKLVVMENGIRGAKGENILGIFDLKGSMVNRSVKGSEIKPTATVKDKNLLALNAKKIWLRFRDLDRRRILSVMAKDVALLKEYNLMDYSLLLCIQENPDYLLLRKH